MPETAFVSARVEGHLRRDIYLLDRGDLHYLKKDHQRASNLQADGSFWRSRDSIRFLLRKGITKCDSVQFSSVQFYLTKTLVNLQHVTYITEKFDKEQIHCEK